MENHDDVELGTIERELYIDAAPEIVFDVISNPEHVVEWWPDAATYEVRPGSTGEIVFGDPEAGGKKVTLTVMEVEPPQTFSFRWTHQAGERAVPGSALLVTFHLVPSGSGTRVRFVETGFHEMDWDRGEAEANFHDHVAGWDHFLPRLTRRAESAVNLS
jgi:uncharacterized protein YndB with AHSA1/START domain